MKFIPNIINEKTITAIIDGEAKVISSSHRNFAKIKKALITGDFDSVPNLIDEGNALVKIGGGDIQVVGGVVKYQGRDIPNYQAKKLLSMLRQGSPNVEPYKKFVANLMENPSARAIEEFARFADYKELPIDEDGYVYAFKGIRADNYSCWGNTHTRVLKGKVDSNGHIWNGVGEYIEVDRRDVCDDFRITCAEGLHGGSRDYGNGYGEKLCLIKFHPKDVVCIPCDADGQKMRLCAYKVISDSERENKKDHAPVLAEGKPVEVPKKATPAKTNGEKPQKDYEKHFLYIVGAYDISSDERDFILDCMAEEGFTDESIIDVLINELRIAEKIERYLAKRPDATFKNIQSALKSESLLQEDIKRIVAKFGIGT